MIEFKKVSFHYSNRIIFQNLDLTIQKGDFIWLEGLNGSGKTTFLRLILDFLRPQYGQIRKSDTVKLGWAPAVDNSFFQRLNGKDNLKFFSDLACVPFIIPNYFENSLVDLILETPFYQMSSGMKQLLIILRSLLIDPDIILLDEPMRGLDQAHRDKFIHVLKILNENKKTIVMTTHQPIDAKFENLKRMRIHDYQIS